MIELGEVKDKIRNAALITATLLAPSEIKAQSESDNRLDSNLFNTHAKISLSVKDLTGESKVTFEKGSRPIASYCAAIQSAAETAAEKVGTVKTDEAGDKLVGFLHIPMDQFTLKDKSVAQFIDRCRQNIANLAEPEKENLSKAITSFALDMGIPISVDLGKLKSYDRHRENREVIGNAIKGYFEEARQGSSDREITIFLGGFTGKFGEGSARVVDNPSGDFIEGDKNTILAIQEAFGDSASFQKKSPDGSLSFEIVSDSHEVTILKIKTKGFTTNPETLDPNSDHSVFKAISDCKPNAILLTGVSSYKHKSDGINSTYIVETEIRPNLLTHSDNEEKLYPSDFTKNESLLKILSRMQQNK
jgi:hypothetical protein